MRGVTVTSVPIAYALTETKNDRKTPKHILIELEKIFFVGVEKKIGYNFDVKIHDLSIYDVFRTF